MKIETRYGLGDVAFGVRRMTAQRRPLCPLCDGSGKVALAIGDRTALCPDCHGRRYDQDDTHLVAQERSTIYRLTIGAVRWSDVDGASYMAHETGLPSGTNWSEAQLYDSYDEALAACADAVVVFGFINAMVPRDQVVIRGEDEVKTWTESARCAL